MSRLVFGFALAVFAMHGAYAADQDDVYFEGVLGFKGETRAKPQFLGGLLIGYCPVDSLGFGIGLDQTLSLTQDNSVQSSTQTYGEGRWFLEPVEIAAGLGLQRQVNFAGDSDISPFLIGAVNYLIAVGPSLALKVEFRAQLSIDEKSSFDVLGGLGARFLY